MDTRWARRWHVLTAVVAVAGLVLQFALVLHGGRMLDEVEPPGTGMRIYRFFAYFTVDSNLLVAAAAITLSINPVRDGAGWRVMRLMGTVGIVVTALVHFFLLRPLLDLDGLDHLADKVQHMVVPALAVVGWLVWGPRPRTTARVVWLAVLYPLVWTAWTMVWGALDGWYPYPFMDPDQKGWGTVAVTLVALTAFFLAVFAGAAALDRRLRPAPRGTFPS